LIAASYRSNVKSLGWMLSVSTIWFEMSSCTPLSRTVRPKMETAKSVSGTMEKSA
jgi:hypothetical protein